MLVNSDRRMLGQCFSPSAPSFAVDIAFRKLRFPAILFRQHLGLFLGQDSNLHTIPVFFGHCLRLQSAPRTFTAAPGLPHPFWVTRSPAEKSSMAATPQASQPSGLRPIHGVFRVFGTEATE